MTSPPEKKNHCRISFSLSPKKTRFNRFHSELWVWHFCKILTIIPMSLSYIDKYIIYRQKSLGWKPGDWQHLLNQYLRVKTIHAEVIETETQTPPKNHQTLQQIVRHHSLF